MADKDFDNKLKNEMMVHKLQQIAEVDDEDSDDAFGPIENGIGSKTERGLVHNSPSKKANPRSPQNGFDINDNFLQPTPEATLEEKLDTNTMTSSRKNKKKGKKVKKRKTKKSSAIAAIEEHDSDEESGIATIVRAEVNRSTSSRGEDRTVSQLQNNSDKRSNESDELDPPQTMIVESNGVASGLHGEPGNNNNFGNEEEDPKSNYDDGAFF